MHEMVAEIIDEVEYLSRKHNNLEELLDLFVLLDEMSMKLMKLDYGQKHLYKT